MATHSSILAWKILWTEEPSRLESMGVVKSLTLLNDGWMSAIVGHFGSFSLGPTNTGVSLNILHVLNI